MSRMSVTKDSSRQQPNNNTTIQQAVQGYGNVQMRRNMLHAKDQKEKSAKCPKKSVCCAGVGKHAVVDEEEAV